MSIIKWYYLINYFSIKNNIYVLYMAMSASNIKLPPISLKEIKKAHFFSDDDAMIPQVLIYFLNTYDNCCFSSINEVTLEYNYIEVKNYRSMGYIYDTVITMPISFKEDVLNCNKRFVLSYISVGGYNKYGIYQPDTSHANCLIYDTEKKEFEIFEPHGEYKNLQNMTHYYNKLRQKLSEVLSASVTHYGSSEHGEYIIYYPLDYCPMDSFQTLEASEVISLLPFEMNGYCAAWTIFYMELRLLNPDKKRDDVVTQAIDYMRSNNGIFGKFIRNYGNFIAKLKLYKTTNSEEIAERNKLIKLSAFRQIRKRTKCENSNDDLIRILEIIGENDFNKIFSFIKDTHKLESGILNKLISCKSVMDCKSFIDVIMKSGNQEELRHLQYLCEIVWGYVKHITNIECDDIFTYIRNNDFVKIKNFFETYEKYNCNLLKMKDTNGESLLVNIVNLNAYNEDGTTDHTKVEAIINWLHLLLSKMDVLDYDSIKMIKKAYDNPSLHDKSSTKTDNVWSTIVGDTFLMHIIRLGYNLTEKLLNDKNIESCIDINKKNKIGESALHIAVKKNTDDIRYLLENRNININIQNIDGETSLHYTIYNNNFGILKLLIEHPNIDPNIKDINGYTPLHIAILDGPNVIMDIKKLLINHRYVNINIKDINGLTPLHMAVEAHSMAVEAHSSQYDNIDIIRQLLERPNIDLNIQNIEGETPLNLIVRIIKNDNLHITDDMYNIILLFLSKTHQINQVDYNFIMELLNKKNNISLYDKLKNEYSEMFRNYELSKLQSGGNITEKSKKLKDKYIYYYRIYKRKYIESK